MSFKNRKRHSVFYEEEQNKEGREEGSRGREGEREGRTTQIVRTMHASVNKGESLLCESAPLKSKETGSRSGVRATQGYQKGLS